MKPVPPDPGIITWLWSPEGAAWHQKAIKQVRHSTGAFAVIKDDHECGPGECPVGGAGSPYPDDQIKAELRRYGLSGVPREWKEQPGR